MRILNTRVDAVDMAGAVTFIAEAIAAGDNRLHQIITLNAEGIYLAQENEEFYHIIEQADLVTPDGAGVLWAAEQLGEPLPERVTGIDLMQTACQRAAQEGWRVYLFGAMPGVAEQAAATLQKHYPGIQIAGLQHGLVKDTPPAEVVARINTAQPDLLFVALGMPFQERYIHKIKEALSVPVAIGVGGSFDVLAGNVKRAPRWMQKLRLEWLWRLLRQPSRIGRMAVLPKFTRLVKAEAKTKRRKTKQSP